MCADTVHDEEHVVGAVDLALVVAASVEPAAALSPRK